MIRPLVALTAVLLLAGCTSSAGSDGSPSSRVVEIASKVPATAPFTVPVPLTPRAGPSDIVNHYDTATCADWAVTDPENRRIVSIYFIVTARNPKVTANLEIAVETAITTACDKLPPSVTVARVAQLSINTLGNNI